jgi:hypothetical protein
MLSARSPTIFWNGSIRKFRLLVGRARWARRRDGPGGPSLPLMLDRAVCARARIDPPTQKATARLAIIRIALLRQSFFIQDPCVDTAGWPFLVEKNLTNGDLSVRKNEQSHQALAGVGKMCVFPGAGDVIHCQVTIIDRTFFYETQCRLVSHDPAWLNANWQARLCE